VRGVEAGEIEPAWIEKVNFCQFAQWQRDLQVESAKENPKD
jgi:hypothetical protein